MISGLRVRSLAPFALLFLFSVGVGFSQDLEGGFHVGYSVLNDDTVLGRETGGEYGVWLNLWPTDRWSVSADWSRIAREDFSETVAGSPYGEVKRNRQLVDLVLQYHFLQAGRWGLFADLGGGAMYNNRHIYNPDAIPGREESGKESTKHWLFTLGGGVRARLVPHLNWVAEAKFHNPGSDTKETIRFITGLTLSWK